MNSNGDKIPLSEVSNDLKEPLGETLDGDAIYHVTFFDKVRRRHISYDTIVVDGVHHYLPGSGHETYHSTKARNRWENDKIVTWRDAKNGRTRELLEWDE